MTDQAHIVLGLGFGDESKGSIVDWLTRQHPDPSNVTVVRYNGGAQAAHNVVTADGEHHTFAQFGSGTLAGARTHLSRFMLINPGNMMNELGLLMPRHGDLCQRVSIDPRALVTTRLHMAYNRIIESARAENRHGSCGQGIGATAEFALQHEDLALRCEDLVRPEVTGFKLASLWNHYQSELEPLITSGRADPVEADIFQRVGGDLKTVAEMYRSWHGMWEWRYDDSLTGDLIFEGAQGVLLDEKWGTAPHHTWSDCTDGNARAILRDLGRDATCIGVTRTYATRHGAGPFNTEDSVMSIPEAHNATGRYQGAWRCGRLNLGALAYSIDHCEQVDAIAVTHCDRAPLSPNGRLKVATEEATGVEYQHLYGPFAAAIADELDRPLYVESHGPIAEDKVTPCACLL